MSADTPKRKNLGRGLNALFGEQDNTPSASVETPPRSVEAPVSPPTNAPITRLPVDLLAPSPFQPRRYFEPTALAELSSSIAEKGVLQPLLVRPNLKKPGHYEIIAGERRWRASQKAQVHEVPVHVTDLSDAEVLEVALIENLQRQDLSPVEEARGYRKLLDEFGHTQERVAEVVGKSRTHVANLVRLLSLPEAVQNLLDVGEITVGQARPLIGLAGAEALARKIVKSGLSARQVERMAKGYGTKRVLNERPKDADTAALEQNLEQATGYTVKISFDGKGGSVSVAYGSLEQLDDIVRRLSSGGRAKPNGASSDIDADDADLDP
jgi:ParB family chromosome partitioning protein